MEPRFNEVLDIRNDFLQPGQNYNKMYGAKPRYNEPRYNEILVIKNTIQTPKRKIYLDIMSKCQHVTKDECETNFFFNPVTRGQQPITAVYIISYKHIKASAFWLYPLFILWVLLTSLSLMASWGKRNKLLEFQVQCPYFFFYQPLPLIFALRALKINGRHVKVSTWPTVWSVPSVPSWSWTRLAIYCSYLCST